MNFVNEMEGILIKGFLRTELYDELSPYLALYLPGGGKHYYNEEQLATELRYVLSHYLREGTGDADAQAPGS